MLGHHNIGDYLWYTVFEKDSYFDTFDTNGSLKEGKELNSHEEILGTITYIHESYHLIQDMTLGFPSWLQYNSDVIALSIHELTSKLPSSLSGYPLSTIPFIAGSQAFQQIEMIRKEAVFLHDCIYTSKITDTVLKAEINANPHMDHSLLECAFGLTGLDLLECHAAILTERYISWLMIRNPSAFNEAMLRDIEPYFRVEKMESGKKVLGLISKYIPCMKFDSANKQHPLYPVCTRAAEYGLILFLLDYALHVCPLQKEDPILPPDMQDVIPTIRFLKIIGSIIPCILELEDKSSFVLAEEYLYSDFMNHIVAFNNKCNIMADKAPTFYQYRDITVKWQKLWEDMKLQVRTEGLMSLFELFCDYRLKALGLMNKNPLQVYTTTITNFAFNIGFSPMYSTNTEVRFAMPWFLCLKEEAKGDYVIPENPFEMTDTFVGKEIFKGISGMIFNGDLFNCPAAERIAFYPCNQRSDGCKSIGKLKSMPQCFARQVLEDFYPNFSQA